MRLKTQRVKQSVENVLVDLLRVGTPKIVEE